MSVFLFLFFLLIDLRVFSLFLLIDLGRGYKKKANVFLLKVFFRYVKSSRKHGTFGTPGGCLFVIFFVSILVFLQCERRVVQYIENLKKVLCKVPFGGVLFLLLRWVSELFIVYTK